MISREKEHKLTLIYFYICDLYEKELQINCQRFSNNSKPEFTDQEIMTIYLFAGYEQRYFQINEIYSFTKDYLLSWFPKLPSYQTFSYRLNLLAGAFQALANKLIVSFKPEDCSSLLSIVDSMPIITSGGKNRNGKVASEITAKGFCSTKNMYYYGCKIHAMASIRQGKIPFPESMIITPAEDNDLTVFKQAWGDNIFTKVILGDKAYSYKEYFNHNKRKTQDIEMLTPVKGIKGQTQEIKQRDKAFNDLFSTAVSKVRQPIESFFNWLNEKTKIQRAMKVRSTAGLLIHLFGKISIAFINLIF
jgi:hypothetical protein